MTSSDAISILQQALIAPQGLLLQASSPETAIQAFQRICGRSLEPAFRDLEFRKVALRDANLAIMKKQTTTVAGANGPKELVI